MQGNADIIELLNEVLTSELTAINQYFVHAKMLKNQGYGPLAKKKREESIEEMHHADSVIERVGEEAAEMHKLDLEVEREAHARLNTGIALAVAKGDNGTRALLESILKSEEESIDWLETHLGLIAELGRERYLAEQIGD